jgi:hypothetical protein
MMKIQMNLHKLFKPFADLNGMKSLKTLLITLAVGMLFAGCTFKAELESRVVSGYSHTGSAYTPVLSECGNDDSR